MVSYAANTVQHTLVQGGFHRHQSRIIFAGTFIGTRNFIGGQNQLCSPNMTRFRCQFTGSPYQGNGRNLQNSTDENAGYLLDIVAFWKIKTGLASLFFGIAGIVLELVNDTPNNGSREPYAQDLLLTESLMM